MIWLMGVMTATNVAALLLVWRLAGAAGKDCRRAAECSEEAKRHADAAATSRAGAEASETRASAVLATAEELEREKTDPAPEPDQASLSRRLSPDERTVLTLVSEAEDIGLALNLECEAVLRFGLSSAAYQIAVLTRLGLVRPVREGDESQGGWCLTPAGVQVVEELRDAGLLERSKRDDAPGNEGKYGTVLVGGRRLHPDEPVFLLRATDPFAPHAVRQYANYCGMHGAKIDHVTACHARAGRIEEWQKENPDLVKKLPD